MRFVVWRLLGFSVLVRVSTGAGYTAKGFETEV